MAFCPGRTIPLQLTLEKAWAAGLSGVGTVVVDGIEAATEELAGDWLPHEVSRAPTQRRGARTAKRAWPRPFGPRCPGRIRFPGLLGFHRQAGSRSDRMLHV